MNVTFFQAEYELSRGLSARDRLNQETEYAFFSPIYIYIIMQPSDRYMNNLLNYANLVIINKKFFNMDSGPWWTSHE
jgi:hypothetical protein